MKKILKTVYILFGLFLVNASLFAQFPIMPEITFTSIRADSADILYYNHKKPWTVTAQIAGLNLGIWAFDRYALKGDYAYISLQSIKNNFSHDFVWDNDQIATNLFGHPYQGSLYYTSARSGGYGYLASSLFAVAGSATWEMFMENEYPSINDAIATPVGGIILGEIFYRTSDRILDDRTTGGERFVRELAAFMVAPARTLSRIINGDAWKIRRTSGRQFGVPRIDFEISLGVRTLELKDKILDEGFGAAGKISVEYGERFETDGMKPYDYCTLDGSFNIQKGQPLLGQINALGRIWATDWIDSQKDYLSIGIYQHFNYYDSDTISDISNRIPYKFGSPASFGAGLMHKSKRQGKWSFNSHFHLNAIILGASINDYSREERDYHLSTGFSVFSGISATYKNKVRLSLRYKGFCLFPWGYPEEYNLEKAGKSEYDFRLDKATTLVNTTTLRFDVKLTNKLYLTNIYSLYNRLSHYDYFENVKSRSSENLLMLTCKF